MLVTVKRLVGVSPPVITPPSGVHEGHVTVVIECAEPGASVLFTLDGSNPGVTSSVASTETCVVHTYSAPFRLGEGTMKVRAIARKAGMADTEGPASVIIVKRRCSAPVLSPPAGALVLGAKVAMSTATWDTMRDARIHFSLTQLGDDGVHSGGGVTRGFYDAPVQLSEGAWRIAAVTMHPKMLPSAPVEAVYSVAAPEAGSPDTPPEQPAKVAAAP
ncbi:hypothetical protein T484DRAFT_1947149, partial [Baffinella frigidus]